MESFWPRASTSARDPAEASEGARRQSWQEFQAGEARFFLPFISRFLHGQEARQGPGKRRTGLSPRARTYGKGAGASERLKQASKPGRARARARRCGRPSSSPSPRPALVCNVDLPSCPTPSPFLLSCRRLSLIFSVRQASPWLDLRGSPLAGPLRARSPPGPRRPQACRRPLARSTSVLPLRRVYVKAKGTDNPTHILCTPYRLP
jgi:hypothetical protein